MPGLLNRNYTDNQLVRCFLLLWTLFNIVQSFFLELHSDEAYYWVYSQFLDWGYFDHPPMVAVFIKIGDGLMHNELGLRLMTIITSSLSFYVIWLALKKYAIKASWFIALVSSVLIFHVYGFTTTPDVALFFFSALFFYLYQRYVDEDHISLAFLLGLVIIGLLYSKYHGVLILFFTLISNLKLFQRRSFWLIIALVIVGFLPHLFWQYQQGFPSVQYHLFDRSETHYEFRYTLGYLFGQLLVAGPLVGWFWFYCAFRSTSGDSFTRALVFNFYGILFFFLISTLKGDVQPQWTLVAYIPLLVLALIKLRDRQTIPKWFRYLLAINLFFILLTRICLMVNVPVLKKLSALRSFYGNQDWANRLKEKAGDAYVLFYNGFQEPSKYDYYTRSLKGFTYDSRTYRKTQFDIWPIEDHMQHQRVYIALENNDHRFVTDSIPTEKKIFYGGWVEDFRSYQRVPIEVAHYKMEANAGSVVKMELTIINPYAYAIDFGDEGYTHKASLQACFMQDEQERLIQTANDDFKEIKINPGERITYIMPVKMPEQTGEYALVFSIVTEPFQGPRNNRFIKINVK